MISDTPNSGRDVPSAEGDGQPRFFDPDRYPWPPDPTAMQLFALAVFTVGGPLTWWAVSR